MQYWVECMKKYADFNGRARRKEYWMFVLFNVIFAFGAGIVDGVLGAGGGIILLFQLALILPALAAACRRMHDTGRSGWMILINIIPFIGAIVYFVFLCSDSKPGANQYGPNPKGL